VSSRKRDRSASKRPDEEKEADEVTETAEEAVDDLARMEIPMEEEPPGCARTLDLQAVRRATNKDSKKMSEGMTGKEKEGRHSNGHHRKKSHKKDKKKRDEARKDDSKREKREKKLREAENAAVVVDADGTVPVAAEEIPSKEPERETALEFQPVYPTSPKKSKPIASSNMKPRKKTREELEEEANEAKGIVTPADTPRARDVKDTVVVPSGKILIHDTPERVNALEPLPVVTSPSDSDGSLSEGVTEAVKGVHESVSLEEPARNAPSEATAIALLEPGAVAVSSSSDMSFFDDAATVAMMEGDERVEDVISEEIPSEEALGSESAREPAPVAAIILEEIPSEDASESVAALEYASVTAIIPDEIHSEDAPGSETAPDTAPATAIISEEIPSEDVSESVAAPNPASAAAIIPEEIPSEDAYACDAAPHPAPSTTIISEILSKDPSESVAQPTPAPVTIIVSEEIPIEDASASVAGPHPTPVTTIIPEEIPSKDRPGSFPVPDAASVEPTESEFDRSKECQDEQMSVDVLEVVQKLVDAVSFLAANEDDPMMDVFLCDEGVITLDPEPVAAVVNPDAGSAKKKPKKKKNRMVGYQLIEVIEEPDKDGIEVTAIATRTSEIQQPSGARPSASQERRSTRIQQRMAAEAACAEEEARSFARTRGITPPSIYPTNSEKVREAREMERELRESREMTRRALAQLPSAPKRPRASAHADGTGIVSKKGTSKRSSRAGSSSRASSSRESVVVTSAASAAELHPRLDGSAAATASSCSSYYDPRSSRRAQSSSSSKAMYVPPSSSSSRMTKPQPPLMNFPSLSPRGPLVGSRAASLFSSSLYPRLGGLCGPRVHQHQPMLCAPSSLHFPSPLTPSFLSTIYHPAWMRPTEKSHDEKSAISRVGHAHFVLPVRMFRTETMIERCLKALEETSIPLPPLQPLLPAPCPLLADGCSDPLSDVLKSVPRAPTGPASYSSHRVQSVSDEIYTTASEGARNHVFSKSEDRKWWEVRTFPSFEALYFHGHRPPLPTSARWPVDGMRYSVADKNKHDIHSLRLATKCTYVTSKKPVFSVHESMPLLKGPLPPPANYRTPSGYSTPAASPYVTAPSPSVASTIGSYGADQGHCSRPSPSSVRRHLPSAVGPSSIASSSSSSMMRLTTPRSSVDVPSTSSSGRQSKKRPVDSAMGSSVASMVKRIKYSFHESFPGRPTEKPPTPLQQQLQP
ncbi:hypothetical protein PMAYCL1PPCAC_11363, partial [Pristionchus mayeri]